MERESFIFYRSFHEAIKCMNEQVQSQIYSAIADYALDGIEPANLCKEAQGMFLLMRPLIDSNNTKYRNGKKGGRPRKNPLPEPKVPDSPYSASFDEEADKMKAEEIWLDGICKNFNLNKEEVLIRLDRFVFHCATECSDKPHTSLADAKRHFSSWMRKAYKDSEPSQELPKDLPAHDYTFNGGFNSIDT